VADKTPLSVIILAAGQGKRMRSARPKVLQPLAGRPLLAHVIASARALQARAIHVVYGHGGDAVPAAFGGEADLVWVLQAEQKGTGHAVQLAIAKVPDGDAVLVLYGDVPLVSTATLERLLAPARRGALSVLTAEPADPSGYGRVLRDGPPGSKSGAVVRIVEHKDADEAQRAIAEVNTGLLAAPAKALKRWVAGLKADNAQREYYLTDCVAAAVAERHEVQGVSAADAAEVHGINDRKQLAEAERVFRARAADALLEAGVTLADPLRFDLRGRLDCGMDVSIDPDCLFEGAVKLGDRVRIGPGCVIKDAVIGADTVVHPHTLIDSAAIGAGCSIGPFARIRPESRIGAGAHVGNFVELKKSELGAGAKANHLAYVGDATVGKDVNVGAGTITCNYDGANKHQTVIGDGAFIGSNSSLVAPVTIGAGATIGAGSVVTKDAPAGELTITRAKQVTVAGWKRPAKTKVESGKAKGKK
jgi:bifunctional UDP-N-acetylglucosamine pyrophosphorylase/glucosamine-1-phosphate N-acetyltransferase